MEKRKVIGILLGIGVISFAAGIAWSEFAQADESPQKDAKAADPQKNVKTIYPKESHFDLEGTQIEGELRNPGEFYFQHRNEEKFDSLVKRRMNFHREMLRDVVLSK